MPEDKLPVINSLDDLKLTPKFKEATAESLGTGAEFLGQHPRFTSQLQALEDRGRIADAALEILAERQRRAAPDFNPYRTPIRRRGPFVDVLQPQYLRLRGMY